MNDLTTQINIIKPLSGQAIYLPDTDGQAASWHLWKQNEVNAICAALAAQRPLLVRGEPGTGKSQLARAAAVALGWRLHTCALHARSEPHDLLYQFDAVRRLADAQAQKWQADEENRYWQPQALWLALNWDSAHGFGSLRTLPDDVPPPPPDGHVVLIDEIDKAPADVPNGLLDVIGARRFEVPALGLQVNAVGGQWPLVIITTNEERELPAAFQRRCMVLSHSCQHQDGYAGFLLAHAQAHFGPGRGSAAAVIDADVLRLAAAQLAQDRKQAQQAQLPPPGLAEYLDLLYALHNLAPGDTTQQRYWLNELNQYAYLKNHIEPHQAQGLQQQADGVRRIAETDK